MSPFAADPVGVPAVQMVAASWMMLALALFVATGDISLLGALVLQEEVSGNQLAGAAIVIARIVLAQSGSAAPPAARERKMEELR